MSKKPPMEHKDTDSSIKQEALRYRALVDSLNDGFGIIDNEGKISYANKKWGALLEYSPEEMIGHPITDFLDEHNRAVLEENIRKRKSGKPSQYEIEWTTKNGYRVCTIVSGAPIIDDDGQHSGSFAVITDITTSSTS